VLARGLVAGFGALALVVGLLVVFGDDSPDDATRPAAEALGERVTADGSAAAGRGATGTTGSTATSAPGAATTGTALGGSSTTSGAPTATVSPLGGDPVSASSAPEAAPVMPSAGPGPSGGPVATLPPPPPPSTAPPAYPSATVAPGPGGSVTVMLADFPAGTTVNIACYHIIIGQGPTQFDGYSATTDGSGSSTTNSCTWNQPGTHVYVLVTGPGVAGAVGSNHYQFPG